MRLRPDQVEEPLAQLLGRGGQPIGRPHALEIVAQGIRIPRGQCRRIVFVAAHDDASDQPWPTAS